MPAKSQHQQEFFGAALARAKAGHPLPGDPKMSMSQMAEFASTPRNGLPSKVTPPAKRNYKIKIKKRHFAGKPKQAMPKPPMGGSPMPPMGMA